jgi:hypothetical protein
METTQEEKRDQLARYRAKIRQLIDAGELNLEDLGEVDRALFKRGSHQSQDSRPHSREHEAEG